MSLPRRPKTEGEVEAEVQSLGLTNEGAAAVVRLANTLKGVRKLQREHPELLSPGRRLHPSSPLSQPVWKQVDIEDSSQLDQETEISGQESEDAGEDQIHPLVSFSFGSSEATSSSDTNQLILRVSLNRIQVSK
jgi:hypothetical protein